MKEKDENRKSEKSFAAGDWVELEGTPGVGRILSVDQRRRRARVELLGRDWIAPLGKLRHGEPPPEDKKPGYKVVGGGSVYYEVDLHGKYVEDAIEQAQRGLDQAVVNHLDSFKIIHGHGSGRVRQAVRKILEKHPHVEAFRFGEPHEGGLACTIALLRKVR